MHAFFSDVPGIRAIRATVVSAYFCNWRPGITCAISHCTCNFVPGLLTLGELSDLAGLAGAASTSGGERHSGFHLPGCRCCRRTVRLGAQGLAQLRGGETGGRRLLRGWAPHQWGQGPIPFLEKHLGLNTDLSQMRH